MAEDAKSEGQVTEDIIAYTMDPKVPRSHRREAGALIVEMCNADSNKLVTSQPVFTMAAAALCGLASLMRKGLVVAEPQVQVCATMLPTLSEWMETGTMLEQHVACHLVAMASNRFDLAGKVRHSPTRRTRLLSPRCHSTLRSKDRGRAGDPARTVPRCAIT